MHGLFQRPLMTIRLGFASAASNWGISLHPPLNLVLLISGGSEFIQPMRHLIPLNILWVVFPTAVQCESSHFH